MTPATVRTAAARIAEHATAHHLARVRVVLHGGEPLLLGLAALRETLAELRAAIVPVAGLDLRMQSNGVLLSEDFCDLLMDYGVRVGISLDGDRVGNDRHRRFANGASSYAKVIRALELLRRPKYRQIYAGILCTIDIANDPIRTYEALLAQQPPRLDFLLPHATWDHPPARPGDRPDPYASWLLRIYDRWMADGRPVSIRLFESLLSAGKGGSSGSEWVGLDAADLTVIETDGAWEQADSTKTAFDGAPATGLNVFSHSVDEVAAHPDIARRQAGLADLCPTCRACPVVRQCGGGLFAHRYRSGSGYHNPSVYCADLKELIVTMNERPSARYEVSGSDAVAIPLELLDQLATGYGDEAAVGYLVDSQLSITRALVVAVAEASARSGPAVDGWQLLSQLDDTAPEAVRSVLMHPYVRVWAVQCLERAEAADPFHLCGFAAVAALRAGVEAELYVPVRDGRIHLPTLGTVTLPAPVDRHARISLARGRFTVRFGPGVVTVVLDDPEPVEGWSPAWQVTADGLTILVEDADPYRDCHDWQAGGQLTAGAVSNWAGWIAAAWQTIRTEVPGQVPGMRTGLRVVTPLRADLAGQLRSATARHAFGAVGAAPATGDALAVLLVHEFQHTKLGAVLDLCDLFDPAYRSVLRVGWRRDERPIEGALQGTYAHLGVADVWRVRAEVAGSGQAEARRLFRQYRSWTSDAADALLSTGALTPAGTRFVSRIAQTLAAWRA
jgi:uncharacterized protein